MKKKIIIYSFILTGCMFNLLECIGQPYHVDFNNYITISNGEFKDGNSIFKPLGINYIVVYPFEQIDNYNRIYYISPTLHYSNIKRNHLQTGIYNSIIRPEDHWGYGDSGASERDSAGIKLENDLRKIDSLGFNVVRLNPSIYWNGDVLTIPTQSYEDYFRLTDSLIAKCTQHGL